MFPDSVNHRKDLSNKPPNHHHRRHHHPLWHRHSLAQPAALAPCEPGNQRRAIKSNLRLSGSYITDHERRLRSRQRSTSPRCPSPRHPSPSHQSSSSTTTLLSSSSHWIPAKLQVRRWRWIILPVFDLLYWELVWSPLIITFTISSLFATLHIWSPKTELTMTVANVVCLSGYHLLPIVFELKNWNRTWTSDDEDKFLKAINHLNGVWLNLNHYLTRTITLRRKSRLKFNLILILHLGILSFIFQRINNLMLMYCFVLVLCLLPGFHHQRIVNRCVYRIKSGTRSLFPPKLMALTAKSKWCWW